MRRTGPNRKGRWLVCLWLLIGPACSSPNAPPLDLTTLDPAQDQREIADRYEHQAVLLRQKAMESLSRAMVYEPLFGADSEWVAATRLLARSYEEAARARERLADKHRRLAGSPPASEPAEPLPR